MAGPEYGCRRLAQARWTECHWYQMPRVRYGTCRDIFSPLCNDHLEVCLMAMASSSILRHEPLTLASSYVAVVNGAYGEPYQFVSSNIPQPGEGEAVVRIEFSGICHGDVYSRDGGGPAPLRPRRPLIGGHEGIGRIVSLGKTIETDLLVGDRVGIAWRSQTCGVCDACRCGAENHCPSQQIVGMQRDGTFQSK